MEKLRPGKYYRYLVGEDEVIVYMIRCDPNRGFHNLMQIIRARGVQANYWPEAGTVHLGGINPEVFGEYPAAAEINIKEDHNGPDSH